MLTTGIVLWFLAGAISNIYFIRKIMVASGLTFKKLNPDDRIGLIIAVWLALFLPPLFWTLMLAFNLKEKGKFSFSLS